MAITKAEVLEWIDSATMLELNDLVKSVEEKYGISASHIADAVRKFQ